MRALELQRLKSVYVENNMQLLPEMDTSIHEASGMGMGEASMTQVIQVELPEDEREENYLKSFRLNDLVDS